MGRIYDATWGRGFSALYDRCFKAAEEAGLRDMRREVLAGARGRVLELGAGTGLNLDLYPHEGLDNLVVTEPELYEMDPKKLLLGVARQELHGVDWLPNWNGPKDMTVHIYELRP